MFSFSLYVVEEMEAHVSTKEHTTAVISEFSLKSININDIQIRIWIFERWFAFAISRRRSGKREGGERLGIGSRGRGGGKGKEKNAGTVRPIGHCNDQITAVNKRGGVCWRWYSVCTILLFQHPFSQVCRHELLSCSPLTGYRITLQEHTSQILFLERAIWKNKQTKNPELLNQTNAQLNYSSLNM